MIRLLFFLIISLNVYAEKYLAVENGYLVLKGEEIASSLAKEKMPIPKEILESKDCSKFLCWQEEALAYLFPMLGIDYAKCPWGNYANNREVEVGGIKMSIDRQFLTGPEKARLDEKTDIIQVKFDFETMKPGRGIYLWIEANWNKYYKTQQELATSKYWRFMHIDPKTYKYKIHNLGKKFGLTEYRIDEIRQEFSESQKQSIREVLSKEKAEKMIASHTRRIKANPIISHFVYTNDDPQKPLEFIVNKYAGHLCISIMFYKNLYIKYFFNKKYLSSHEDIKTSIINLINQWSQS